MPFAFTVHGALMAVSVHKILKDARPLGIYKHCPLAPHAFQDPLIKPTLGFIIPIMGIKKPASKVRATPKSGTADALFTKVQQRVLGLLFGNPARSFYANEIIALAGSGTGAVQRELGRLDAAGLVTVKRLGNQKHYQANAAAPVFEELRGLILKTSGLADVPVSYTHLTLPTNREV